jgi:hypothetical protein
VPNDGTERGCGLAFVCAVCSIHSPSQILRDRCSPPPITHKKTLGLTLCG